MGVLLRVKDAQQSEKHYALWEFIHAYLLYFFKPWRVMTTIAIAGHTNWGKTTLIRTMTKATVGTIDDRAGATQESEIAEYPALHAKFIDCPGFTQANTIWKLMSTQRLALADIKDDPDFELDRRAIVAFGGADAVIYVCSLESVPSDQDRFELRLIKHLNSRTLAVLNKRRQQTLALGKNGVAGRERQWRELLSAEGVAGVFDFDSHWDQYSKLTQIYGHLATLLPPEKKIIFESGLRSFEKELASKRSEASKLAAGCVRACRTLVEAVESERHGFNVTAARSALRSQLVTKTTEMTTEFVNEVRKLYMISIETGSQTYRLNESEFKRAGDRFAAMATHSAVGAGVLSILGGFIGFFTAGPLGAAAGVALGAKLGGGVGAAGGLITGALTETNTHLEVRLSGHDLREIAHFCLAIMWCLTHQGFGKDPRVIETDFRNSLEVIKANVSPIRHPEWERSSDSTMAAWFEEQMNSLAI